MIAIYLLLALLLLLAWLLLAPISLEVDTDNSVYQVKWRGIAKVNVLFLPSDLLVRTRFFFWHFDFYPLHPKEEKEVKKPDKKKEEKKKAFDLKKWARKGKRLIRSFEVRVFRINVDTDDYVVNAYLFPVFHFLSNRKRQLKINYEGKLECKLSIYNRPYRILTALLF